MMKETTDIFESDKNYKVIYADNLKYMPRSSIMDVLSTSPLGTHIKGIVDREDGSECKIRKEEKSNRFVGTSYVWYINGDETSESYIANIIHGNSDKYALSDAIENTGYEEAETTIKNSLDDLEDGEALVYKVVDGFGLYDKLVVTKNPKYTDKYIMWNEDKDKEVFNKTEMSDLFNTVYWIKKEALTYIPKKVKVKDVYKVKENMDNPKNIYEGVDDKETVDLFYDDLYVEVYFGDTDWETGYGEEEFSGKIDYTYTVDIQDVIEFLEDFLYSREPEYAKIEDDDEAYKWIYDHFNELFDKYEKDILEYFREDAEDDAQNNEYIEDYIY